MRIVIETNGLGTESKIEINGVLQEKLKFFEVSMNVDYSNKVKLMMTKKIDGKYIPMEFFGEGLRKFDEISKLKEENDNGKHIGSEK